MEDLVSEPRVMCYREEVARLVGSFCLTRVWCAQEQPLLLEDLLEQEKREQEKQHQQTHDSSGAPPLLNVNDLDFERLQSAVLGGAAPQPPNSAAPQQGVQGETEDSLSLPIDPREELAKTFGLFLAINNRFMTEKMNKSAVRDVTSQEGQESQEKVSKKKVVRTSQGEWLQSQ